MTNIRMTAQDVEVRVDSPRPGETSIVLYALGQHAVVLSGSVESVLMLADRINDRLYRLREEI